jgi:hypothetical protein
VRVSDVLSPINISAWVEPTDPAHRLVKGPVSITSSEIPTEYDIIQNGTSATIRLRDKGSEGDLNFFLNTGRARIAWMEQVAPDGSGNLKIEFFNGALLDLGIIEIGLDEKSQSAARRALRIKFQGIQDLAKSLAERCVLKLGPEPDNEYLFVLTGPAGDDIFESHEDTGIPGNTEQKQKQIDPDQATPAPLSVRNTIPFNDRAFCICADGIRIAVVKKSVAIDKEIFVASKIIASMSNNSDMAIRLARGRISFTEFTKTGQVRALAASTLNLLLQNKDSYLRKWDEYGAVEGEFLLARARKVGALHYNRVEIVDGFVKFFLTGSVPDELCEGDELEITRETPAYLSDPYMNWQSYCIMLDQEQKAEGTGDRHIKRTRRPPSSTVAKVRSIHENSLVLNLRIPPAGNDFAIIFSVNGERIQIERRMQARRLIVEGRSANPLLGIIIEEGGVLPESSNRRASIPPLSGFVKEKVFSHAPTDKQEEAIRIALNTPDIALIQGPPGTGKTTVISAIIERLNEMCDKRKSIRGEILITGFQHDAVENLMARLTVNSLPVPKFGKRGEQGNEAAGDISRERVRLWSEEIGSGIKQKHPELHDSESQKRLIELCHQYCLSPSLFHAIHILDAVLQMPREQIGPEMAGTAGDLKELLEDEMRMRNIGDLKAVELVRSLRTSSEGFGDDGPERCSDVLIQCERQLCDKDMDILKQAIKWLSPEAPSFLAELRQLKVNLLERYSPHPVFKIEKAREDVVQFIVNLLDRLQQHTMHRADSHVAVLSELLHCLEHDPDEVQKAIGDYSYVFAATCQQCQGSDIVREKALGVAGEKGLTAYDTVIVDEAARTSPRDLLIPMAQARKRIVLVGDHRQLPHMIDEEIARILETQSEDSETKSVPSENDYIKKSMFQYLFHRLEALEKRDKIPRRVTLDKQFRMHPLLGDLISDQFYRRFNESFDSPLPPAYFVHSLPGTKGLPVLWLDVPAEANGKEKMVGTSRSRTAEARSIARKLNQWIDTPEGKDLSFGIISFYRAQTVEIMKELASYNYTSCSQNGNWEINPKYAYLPAKKGKLPEERLRVGTVDAFQGMEFDVVFLSMVRSRPPQDKFEKNDLSLERQKRKLFGHLMSSNRLCVSMSRQKRLLVVVGNKEMVSDDLGREAVPALAQFYRICMEKGGLL